MRYTILLVNNVINVIQIVLLALILARILVQIAKKVQQKAQKTSFTVIKVVMNSLTNKNNYLLIYFMKKDNGFGQMQNSLQCVPLINLQEKLVVYLYDQGNSFFQLGDYQDFSYLFEYRFNNTNLFYDINNKKLLASTGSAKNYFQNSQVNWWKVSIDYEERYNTNDANDASLICIVSQQGVTNVVNDLIRKLIYVVVNSGITLVYNYNLKLITTIDNSCLKQAILTYDKNFVYSICPNSIIIYNGLSFQQQFPIINNGIKDATNIIDIGFNYYFIVIQKMKTLILQLRQDGYQYNIKDIFQPYSIIESVKLINDSSQSQLQVLLSTYNNIQYFILPLTDFENCSVSVKYQNQPLENIKNIMKLNQITSALFNSLTLSLVEIEYQNIQCFQNILSQQQSNNNINLDTLQQLTLVIQSESQKNQIFNMSFTDVFYIDGSNQITISNVMLTQSNQVNLFNVKFVQNFKLTDLFINKVTNSQILNVYATDYTLAQNFTVIQSSQIQLVKIQPLQIEQTQQFCQYFQMKIMNISQSEDIQLQTQADIIQINNLTINNLSVKQQFFSIITTDLLIKKVDLQGIVAGLSYENSQLFVVNNFQNSTISQITCNDCQITIISLTQQLPSGQSYLSFCKFENSTINKSNSLIQFSDLQNLTLDSLTVKNITIASSVYSSIIIIKQCNQTNIYNSTFKSNSNIFGQGGSIYAIENANIKIVDCVFQNNNCDQQNGGALFIQNKMMICQLRIESSQFIQNNALVSTGGAISLSNSNLNMEDSLIQQNIAAIGGGIYYEQIVPDLVLDQQKGIYRKNKIIENNATFYGNNFGSTLRQIGLNLNDIKVPSYSIKKYQKEQIFIQQLKSGNSIFFEKIQLLDEENNPIQYPQIQSFGVGIYSSNVESIIQQISIQIICDQNIQQMQCSGELQSKQIISDGLKLNVQIMYQPQTQMTLLLQSNKFPQLQDSQGNVYISQSELQMWLAIQFDSCSVGEIQKQIGDSIICDECPEGKYSLNQNDLSCQQCPDSAVKCQSSTINLKNGYWRLNNETDDIVYCIFNPESCKPEYSESKFNCIKGNIGPLCYSCDVYGQIWGESYSQIFNPGVCYKCEEKVILVFVYNFIIFLFVAFYTFFMLKNILQKQQAKLISYYLNQSGLIFLGSTIYKSDKPQIVSKILTDHLQIISLLASFQFNSSNYYKLPFQISGGSVNITSKSIDCYFSNHPQLQPLWLFQFAWSFMLPLSLLVIYLITYFISKTIIKKKNIIVKYLKTAAIFLYLYFFPMIVTLLSRSMNCIHIGKEKYMDLDLNVRCLDSQIHKPYILSISIPLLILWAFIIPLFLFLKVRHGKRQKWTIFEEIKYSFIFAGYKEQFYYWEFGKLVYKSLLIIISVLFQQIEFFK
ncbi:hypothetical protein ABPG74_019314, partial [Tetrahymena malaccensis]